jgi:hypothetical protein
MCQRSTPSLRSAETGAAGPEKLCQSAEQLAADSATVSNSRPSRRIGNFAKWCQPLLVSNNTGINVCEQQRSVPAMVRAAWPFRNGMAWTGLIDPECRRAAQLPGYTRPRQILSWAMTSMSVVSEIIEHPLTPDALGERYRALCADPALANLPGKIALDIGEGILMTSASNYHGAIRSRIGRLLAVLDGTAMVETSVLTEIGVLVADVAWASAAFMSTHRACRGGSLARHADRRAGNIGRQCAPGRAARLHPRLHRRHAVLHGRGRAGNV